MISPHSLLLAQKTGTRESATIDIQKARQS